MTVVARWARIFPIRMTASGCKSGPRSYLLVGGGYEALVGHCEAHLVGVKAATGAQRKLLAIHPADPL